MRPFLAGLLVAVLAAAPAGAQTTYADHVATEDVALLQNIRTTGSAMGGGLHGDRLLVSGPTQLSVFDARDPRAPQLLGTAPLGNANESDDVASDGRWAAVAEAECLDPGVRGSCIAVFDVSAAPQRIASLGLGVQTVACVLACRYLWATGENTIVDMADPKAPKAVGSFLAEEGESLDRPCVFAREVRPGVVTVSCDPTYAVSTLPEHGGTPTAPVAFARADLEAFSSTLPVIGGVPHGARWPHGRDRFLMTTTETPFSGTCGGARLGAFVVWDAQPVLTGGRAFRSVSTWRPSSGTYTNGRSPYNAVGCSPHLLAEHPAFRDGGIVAVAALENGVRLLQISADGAIQERGYFLGLGGTAALPVWHPDGRTLYVIDYARGLDVLDYSGPTYLPPPAPAAAPAPPQPAAPSKPKRFHVLGVIRNRRGQATIAAEAPGPGVLTATPRSRGARWRTLRVQVHHAGLTTLRIAAQGRARALLRRRGRLPVDVRLVWRPKAGPVQRARQRVVLRSAR